MQENPPRLLPVIVITGTSGIGTTTFTAPRGAISRPFIAHQYSSMINLKEKTLHDGFDEDWRTYIVDKDKVCSHHDHG